MRLTPEARDALNAALNARWREDGARGRLTWEARTERLGVGSVATAKRILFGEGVDRATLELAFKSLGLAWDDAVCEPPADEPEPPTAAVPVSPIPPPPAPPVETPAPPRRPSLGRPILVAALVGLALAGIAAWGPSRPAAAAAPATASAEWVARYDQALTDARRLYDEADYRAARRRLDDAMAMTRGRDSIRLTEGALHIAGDIAAAQGDLEEAKGHYDAAIRYRKLPGLRPWAELHESLGIVEMRLGKLDASRRDLEIALAAYRTARQPIGVAQIHRDLAMLAFRAGDPDAAEAWFRKSLTLLRPLAQPALVVDVRGERAMLRMEQGEPLEARDTLRECLAFWEKEGHPRWIGLGGMRLGLAEEALGHPELASPLIAKAKARFDRVGDLARVKECATHLHRLATRLTGT